VLSLTPNSICVCGWLLFEGVKCLIIGCFHCIFCLPFSLFTGILVYKANSAFAGYILASKQRVDIPNEIIHPLISKSMWQSHSYTVPDMLPQLISGQVQPQAKETVMFVYFSWGTHCHIYCGKMGDGGNLRVCRSISIDFVMPNKVVMEDNLVIIGEPQMEVLDFRSFIIGDQMELKIFREKVEAKEEGSASLILYSSLMTIVTSLLVGVKQYNEIVIVAAVAAVGVYLWRTIKKRTSPTYSPNHLARLESLMSNW